MSTKNICFLENYKTSNLDGMLIYGQAEAKCECLMNMSGQNKKKELIISEA